MKLRKLLASFFVSLLMASQLSFVALAADDAASAMPPAAPAVEQPAASTPATTPSPAPADPGTPPVDQTTSPTPDPAVDPAPAGTPSDPTASATPPATPPATDPAPVTGPTEPTGADPAQKTGPSEPTGVIPDWVFNAGTRKWEEADKSSFSWDEKSGYYLSPKYYYDTRIGWYEILPPSQANDPERPSYLITAAPAEYISTPFGDIKVGSPEYKMAMAMGLINDPAISNTGPNSNNTATLNNNNNGWIDMTNLVNLINTIQSESKSGDASVSGNTGGGSAVSGAANVIANLINLLSSAWSWSNGSLSYFAKNLFGNHNGDIVINPKVTTTGGGSQLGGGLSSNDTTGPNSNNNATTNNNNNLNVNGQNQGNITNNVNVDATSGNANVGGNTRGGSATSGDATAEVNIINMINSLINSGESFFGILNIFGNLNGDILFPDGFLNDAVGDGGAGGSSSATNSNTGPGSINNATVNNNNNANLNTASSSAFNNNVNSKATSGSANTSGNTSAGSATTGDASTNNSLFNLNNTSVFGDNAVLVIVNVMGHWMGKIMHLGGDGHSGAALLTGNATVSNNNTGPNSNNNATVNDNNNLNLNASNSGTITNNVNANATSGNANVSGNTQAGDATSGKAKVATNIANLYNSALNVKHWFGVLIINVFGDWFGSVNENTEAGNQPAVVSPASQQSVSQPAVSGLAVAGGVGGGTVWNTASGSTTSQINAAGNDSAPIVSQALHQTQVAAAAQAKNVSLIVLASVISLLIAGALFSVERRMRART